MVAKQTPVQVRLEELQAAPRPAPVKRVPRKPKASEGEGEGEVEKNGGEGAPRKRGRPRKAMDIDRDAGRMKAGAVESVEVEQQA